MNIVVEAAAVGAWPDTKSCPTGVPPCPTFTLPLSVSTASKLVPPAFCTWKAAVEFVLFLNVVGEVMTPFRESADSLNAPPETDDVVAVSWTSSRYQLRVAPGADVCLITMKAVDVGAVALVVIVHLL